MTYPRYWCGPSCPDEVTSITFDEYLKLPAGTTVCLDTETTGLNVRKDKVIMLQLYIPKQYSIAFDTRKWTLYEWEEVYKRINSTSLVIGANIAFDYNMAKKYRQVLTGYVYDVLDAEQVMTLGKITADDNKRYKMKHGSGYYALASLVMRYLNKELPKDARKNFSTIGDKPFTYKEIDYGLRDAEVLYDVYTKQLAVAVKLGFTKMIKLDDLTFNDLTFSSYHSLCLADLEYNGMPIVPELWMENIPYFKEKALEAYSKLVKAAKEANPMIATGLFGDSLNIKWTSPKQVLHFFKTYLGIDLRDRFGKPSTSSKVLMRLNHPVAKELLNYRKAVKSITAFGKKFIGLIEDDGRIHASYTRMVSTFRVSAKSPNLQQIPRDNRFRRPVQAPEGYMILTGDYPQQEPHIGGHKTKDESIKEFYERGHGDMHSFLASKILTIQRGKPVEIPPKKENDPEALALFEAHPDKAFRQIGKGVGLAIDYGTSPAGMAYNLKISVEEAKGLKEAVFKAFPKKLQYFEKMFAYGLTNGFVYLSEMSAIRRYFPEHAEYMKLKQMPRLTKTQKSKLNQLKGSIERKSINTPTQGTAALMTKAASILERRRLIKAGILPLPDAIVQPILAVHDEKAQLIKVPEGVAYKHIMSEAMEEASQIYCSFIPMKVKPEFGKHWTH